MLVMRRRAGERLLIGEAIEIEILEICGSRVRLGIVAPDSVLIQRKEAKLTREQNITAAASVQRQSISSLVDKLGMHGMEQPVKNLTDAAAVSSKST